MPPFPLASIPHMPGCYLYKDKDGQIIYIGKAKDLKKRVASYFAKNHEDEKTRQLAERIASVELFITTSEHEALLLEANLIKKHKPKYNLELKGGRRYAYILLTDEPYPRLLTARDTSQKGAYYGPFTNGYARQTLLQALQKTFRIRTCRTLPKKPCLRYHLGLCKAPCAGHQSKEDYNHNIGQAAAYLKGGTKTLLKTLEKEMHVHAQAQEYEQAREKRDQIAALQALQERQDVEAANEQDMDAINYVASGENIDLFVFSVRNGLLGDKDEYALEKTDDFLEEFIKRYYEDKGRAMPTTILVPQDIDQDIAGYLSEKAGRNITITSPQRGSKKHLLELVRKNIEAIRGAPSKAAEQLQETLSLPSPPKTIETFDISHLSGTGTVASMVQFLDGKPNKAGYRRFKIKTVDQVDDFRSMQEVVGRRYRRLLEEHKPLPDLVVIDGGAQQLAFALKVLDEAGADIPIIGLAKKEEEIYLPDEKTPLRIDKRTEMMKLLIATRDEAHRFAINYQRLLRSKQVTS